MIQYTCLHNSRYKTQSQNIFQKWSESHIYTCDGDGDLDETERGDWRDGAQKRMLITRGGGRGVSPSCGVGVI